MIARTHHKIKIQAPNPNNPPLPSLCLHKRGSRQSILSSRHRNKPDQTLMNTQSPIPLSWRWRTTKTPINSSTDRNGKEEKGCTCFFISLNGSDFMKRLIDVKIIRLRNGRTLEHYHYNSTCTGAFRISVSKGLEKNSKSARKSVLFHFNLFKKHIKLGSCFYDLERKLTGTVLHFFQTFRVISIFLFEIQSGRAY